MEGMITEMIEDIVNLLPEFKGREQELKEIIDKLLQSQPKVEMDEEFKQKLREKIISHAQNKKRVIPLYKRLFFIVPGGMAAALILALGIGFVTNKHGSSTFDGFISETPVETVLEHGTAETLQDNQEPSRMEILTQDYQKQLTQLQSTENQSTQNSPDQPQSTENQSTQNSLVQQQPRPVDRADLIAPSVSEAEPMEDLESSIELNSADDLVLAIESEEAPMDGLLAGSEGQSIRMMSTQEVQSPRIMEEERDIIDPNLGYVTEDFNTEEFTRIYENQFLTALNDPISTFSIDVDTASYSNVRRYLFNGSLPPADAVRIEELINYFDYGYPDVEGEHPFDFNTALSTCPWNQENLLLYVGVQGERMAFENLPPNNLVFLLDVSGSMADANKLPLLKQSLEMLTQQLRPQDRVSIVVYAGAAGVVLQPTAGNKTERIISAFDRLEAGGSTAGGQGIELAYNLAEETFMEEGNNRIIIATDGDFNVGPSSTSETTRLIEEKRDKGIFLTVLGFGMGNYKDSRMEQMADKGNGNYAYIDNIMEAKKVLVNEISSTLFTIASDVKIQIEFNPYMVEQYRLIGYENRVMANQDFNDDTKDAGELGAGHSVTAIYEIVQRDRQSNQADDLRYQDQNINDMAASSGEIMTIKFRYKNPGEDQSILIERPVAYQVQNFQDTQPAFRFAAAVAQWGMLLRDSEYRGDSSFQWVLDTARSAVDYDPYGLKAEFLNLVELSELNR
jgi:Ca-activated chloride channel family protein